MTASSTVYAVIVTYNRKEMLTKCLDAVLNQTRLVNTIIIIDNNSTDQTEDYLRQNGYLKKEQIQYVKLAENIGGAGGFHEGMKLARENAADWIWIMDDDVIPDKTCLEELLKAKDSIPEKVSFFASSIRGINGEALNVPKINRNQFTKYTDWYRYLDNGMVQIVKATFVSLLISGEAVKKCGLPWKPFFLWGDDSEYTQRLIRDYGPAYMVGKSKAIHMRNGGEELSLVKETNINRIPLYYYYYRNNLIGFWEYETNFYKFLCLGKLFYDFCLVITKGKYKGKKLRVILKALISFVLGLYDRKDFENRSNY